jgi:hypothetical protein
MSKIPEPGLPELRRIRQLETMLIVLIAYCEDIEKNEGFEHAVKTAKKLLDEKERN